MTPWLWFALIGWLVSLVPTNPMKAAADGAMLPLVVFTLAFGLALGRLAEETRRPVVGFFRGVSDAMTVLIRWILALAPIGIFALALVLATKLGTEAIGAAAFYVVAVSALLLASTLLLYLFIALWIMSIFGNLDDIERWRRAGRFELFHWSIAFALVAVAAIVYGLRHDDGMLRGFGLTFLFINLYTRFFEYFWDSMHKAIFFAVLALSFWFIGSRAERIWHFGQGKLAG